MIQPNKLRELIDALATAFAKLNEVTGLDPTPGVLHPPAAQNEIVAFEKKMGYVFPDSYRVFLSYHNGWEGYRRVYTLIGVKGDHTRKALESIEQDFKIFRENWEKIDGKATPERIRKFESEFDENAKTEAEAHIYLPSKIAFATDFAGGLYLFDPTRLGRGGEPKVFRRNQKGEIIGWYDDFVAMLKFDLEFVTKRVKTFPKV